jgi:hypothetical protein
MRNRRIPLHTFPLAHVDRTMYYERVVASVGGGPFQAQYAELVSVSAGGQTAVNCPVVAPGTATTTKDTFHFGVVSADGTGPVTINGNGFLINGGASVTLAASPGASAHVYFSVSLGAWVAFMGAGGAFGAPPPTYTAKGPAAPQVFTNAGLTAVNNSSITTAPFSASQKAIITYTVELTNTTAGANAQANFGIFDGVAASQIDVWHEALVPAAAGETTDHRTVTVVTEVLGNGGARTFGLSIVANDANNLTVPTNGCRGVVQIVDG